MDRNLLVSLRNYFSSQPIKKAWLFGSVARGEEGPNSDYDILVNFDEDVSLFKFTSMISDLESLVRKTVDLVSETSLLPWVKEDIEKDKILIYEREAKR